MLNLAAWETHGLISYAPWAAMDTSKSTSNLPWLVVYLPLWKIWKLVGMINPNIWKNKIHVPNHQPESMYGDVREYTPKYGFTWYSSVSLGTANCHWGYGPLMMNPISIVIMLISCRVPLKQPPLKEFSIESKLQQDAGIPKNRNICTVLVRWNNGHLLTVW